MDVGGQVPPPSVIPSSDFGGAAPAVAVADDALPIIPGLIIPPPDIRSVIEKTAAFVAKNGIHFERRVLAEPGNKQKFGFLQVGNPYRGYYEAKVREHQNGEKVPEPAIPEAILARRKREHEKQAEHSAVKALTLAALDPIHGSRGPKALKEGLNLLALSQASSSLKALELIPSSDAQEDDVLVEVPPKDVYTVDPPFATLLDLEIIKRTAQFAAKNGQKFIMDLSHRERGNPQFAFVKSGHPLFHYFTELVEAYTLCLVPEPSVIEFLKQIAGNTTDNSTPDQRAILQHLWPRALRRFRYDDKKRQEHEEKEKRERIEREATAALDWHNFTVVECINFTEADFRLDLGPAVTLEQYTRPRVLPPLISQNAGLVSAHAVMSEIRDAVGDEGIESLKSSEPQMTLDHIVAYPHPVPPIILPTASPPNDAMPVPEIEPKQQVTETQAFQQEIKAVAPPPTPAAPSGASQIVVVKGYRREKRTRTLAAKVTCPITGEQVAADQLSEHLRIVLLDPKWKQQKDRVFQEAKRESALVDDADFYSNLADFVLNRPDMFGSVEEQVHGNYIQPAPKRGKND